MNEYINRDGVMKKAISTGLCDGYGNMYGAGDVVLVEDIQAIPAADVAPVVYGRWESHLLPISYKCSACGYRPSAKAWGFHKKNYCPNCGAKME